jgi:DNA-binding NarL/FixJ family response regulator
VLDYCPQFDVAGEADNGATAIELARALQPDVVLLDISMPVLDGSGALCGLVSAAPNAQIVVLSGMDKSGAQALLEAGAAAFLPKGLAPFELLERLGSILGRRVTLQREAASAGSPSPAPAPSPRAQPQAAICDDDPMARRLIAQVLANCGIPVVAETDVVPNLLSVVEVANPELVILDLWLEGTTGTSALPEIRRTSPSTLVVVYSAHEHWSGKSLAAGAAAFVAKPNFDELEVVIRRLTQTATP